MAVQVMKLMKVTVERINIWLQIILQSKSVQPVNSLELNYKTANFPPE